MAKKQEVPTGREVHLEPEQCDNFYRLINNVGAKDAGGLQYAMQLADLIKAVGSARKDGHLEERAKFGRLYGRVAGGKDGDAERQRIEDELTKWREKHKLTNECFSTSPTTIAIAIPPESNTVILHSLIFHARAQMGGGMVQIMEFCDKFELRAEFIAEGAIRDAEDKKAEAKKKES